MAVSVCLFLSEGQQEKLKKALVDAISKIESSRRHDEVVFWVPSLCNEELCFLQQCRSTQKSLCVGESVRSESVGGESVKGVR